jgi:cyanate permease
MARGHCIRRHHRRRHWYFGSTADILDSPSGAAAAGAIALINSVGNIGGFVGPFLIGWLKETTGSFTGGPLASGTGVLLTGILTMALGRERYVQK